VIELTTINWTTYCVSDKSKGDYNASKFRRKENESMIGKAKEEIINIDAMSDRELLERIFLYLAIALSCDEEDEKN
jgi:hypothetical protein